MLVSLKENAAFRRLYYRGKSAANRYLVVYCRRNGLHYSRLGLTTGTKLGSAVVRNRIRRRLREIVRAQEDKLPCGYDIVIVARTAAVNAEFSALAGAFTAAAEKLELIRQ